MLLNSHCAYTTWSLMQCGFAFLKEKRNKGQAIINPPPELDTETHSNDHGVYNLIKSLQGATHASTRRWGGTAGEDDLDTACSTESLVLIKTILLSALFHLTRSAELLLTQQKKHTVCTRRLQIRLNRVIPACLWCAVKSNAVLISGQVSSCWVWHAAMALFPVY